MNRSKRLLLACVACSFLVFFVLLSSRSILPTTEIFYSSRSEPLGPGELRISPYGNYCVVHDVLRGSLVEDKERVTLVVHASYDRIGERAAIQVNNWQGPVSLAVVFPSEDRGETTNLLVACTLQKLWSLRERHPQVAERLSVHFLLPPRGNACPLRPLPPGNCSEPPNNFEEAVRSAAAYPVNAARNVARRLAKTKLILVADLDHLFSANFAPKMAALAKKELSENPKRALVYRIFEIEKDVQRFPETKADLSALYQSGQAAVFHKHYYAHRIPLLAEWFEAPETGPDETPSVQFVRPYNVSAWEPQFVSLATIPDHDESFPYPVRDNTVLRWEMCRTGFEFAIVHDVFMFHHGVKKAEESRIVTSARQRVQKRASAALTSFTARMRREHPDTEQDCPVFQL